MIKDLLLIGISTTLMKLATFTYNLSLCAKYCSPFLSITENNLTHFMHRPMDTSAEVSSHSKQQCLYCAAAHNAQWLIYIIGHHARHQFIYLGKISSQQEVF